MQRLFFGVITLLYITCIIACNATGGKKLAEINKKPAEDSIKVKLELVTNAVEMPLELQSAPDSTHRFFITDNKGKIWIMKNDSVLSKPFLNIYDKIGQQKKTSMVGTVYSFAFSPQFSTNRKFYVFYNAPTKVRGNTCKMVLSEFKVDKSNPDLADLASEKSVLEIEGSNAQNNGSQIEFGPDGYLYVSVGDNKGADKTYIFGAQDLNSLSGKLLRINVNKLPYTIPADNPFVATKNARPEIWAYGFRKLWHYSFDPVSHEIFGGDIGEEKEEEVDIVKKGADYGWPVMEGDSVFRKDSVANATVLTKPINTYTHKTGICVIGGSYYYGNEIASLKNKYVFGDFNGSMFALTKNAQGSWIRQPLKIINKPTAPFLMCGCTTDKDNDLFIMGVLNAKTAAQGAIYKVVKI
ncbi:MAG: PQQ-dependent sugar dehydrogenase [Bacteroidota bacterium]|nr:PQQ-dependent sugar dehydrogenase [Bacteroidota bacterium]